MALGSCGHRGRASDASEARACCEDAVLAQRSHFVPSRCCARSRDPPQGALERNDGSLGDGLPVAPWRGRGTARSSGTARLALSSYLRLAASAYVARPLVRRAFVATRLHVAAAAGQAPGTDLGQTRTISTDRCKGTVRYPIGTAQRRLGPSVETQQLLCSRTAVHLVCSAFEERSDL